jgi:CRISPR-associated protein Cmr6
MPWLTKCQLTSIRQLCGRRRQSPATTKKRGQSEKKKVGQSTASAALGQCAGWHLRLDKFSNDVADPTAAPPATPAKTTALKNVLSTYTTKAKLQLQKVIDAKLAWLGRVATQAGPDHHRVVTLIADSKLIVALGRAHALQNVGLSFERTTGLPQIPGSAIKGIVSTWASWSNAGEGLFESPPRVPTLRTAFGSDLAARIFGDNSETGSAAAGEVIFLGGYPEKPPVLSLDIVNPHHETNGTDKRNLTPNIFLCLEPGTRWRFPIIIRPGARDPAALLQAAGDWLIEALIQTGIGAKTAAGYGRFKLLPEAARDAGLTSSGDAAPSDYTEKSFAAVLDRMNNAGAAQAFQADLKTLQLPQNTTWLAKLKAYLAMPAAKDTRKRLKDKPWFPKVLLPNP